MFDYKKTYINSKKWLLLFCGLTFFVAGNAATFCFTDSITQKTDSIFAKTDSITAKTDSLNPQKPQKKSVLDAAVDYSAQDSIVFLANGTAFLYGKSEIKYQDIDLKSDFMRIKTDSSYIYATGTVDSVGAAVGDPEFTDGKQKFVSKELSYNLKTKKAFVRQAVSQQGEGYIISEQTKKGDGDEMWVKGAKYTTCDEHDNPHFYLGITKGKVKQGKYVVSGPAKMVLLDVPLPVMLPFGYFPFNTEYSSGLLMPTYADELSRGLGLINGGYYFAFNDYVDLELKGEIYTKGTWGVNMTSSYLKRYKFNGRFNMTYREDVTGEKDMPDYAKRKNFNVTWNHSQDAKANPFMTFSANVNFSTSGYNRSNINSYYNPAVNSENTKASSVSFSKRFPTLPSLNMTGAMNITQRTKDSTITMTLPDVSISYSSTKPFKRKNAAGTERWYEKITMSYSGTFQNSVRSIKEERFFNSSFTRDWDNGAKHSIPINATFNVLNYISITPNASYTERWYTRSIRKSWDTKNAREIRDTVDGFRRAYDFNVGVSASTKLYGYYTPLRSIFGDKIDRIRHVVTPTVSYSFRPDFSDPMWNFYGTYLKKTDNGNGDYRNEEVRYSYFEGSMYGSPGGGRSQNLNFSLGNNLEMKVRNDNDTTGKEPFKKVSLIDNFSISTSYNMVADSMRWSNPSANLRIKLGTYTLSLSGTFDIYQYALVNKTASNQLGTPIHVNKFRKVPKFLGTSTNYSYTLNNDTFDKWFGKKDKKQKTKDEENAEKQNDFNSPPLANNADKKADNATETDNEGYEKPNIKWSIGINYTISYGENRQHFNYEKMDYGMKFTHHLSFSGNLALTSNWSANTSITYDFEAKKFSYATINVSRQLHCWSMSASFVPFGYYKSYNFHIGVNSSMLADLKYDKRSYGNKPITWY